LRLSYDHRVEARGNTENVSNGIILAVLIKMGFELKRIQLEILSEELTQVACAIFHAGKKLDTVAGRNNHAFSNAWMLNQFSARFRQARFRNRQALTHLDRRRLVIHADELKSHEATNL